MNDWITVKMVRILLVEDDPADADLTREALKEAKFRNDLYVVPDGETALRFLRQEDEFADTPRPDLILLDLNLPRVTGLDVLKVIKTSTELKTIPVVILTTSSAEKDILASYQLHANCYITKPMDLDKFIDMIKQIKTFWLSLVKLPDQKIN